MPSFNDIAEEALANGQLPCVLEVDAPRGVLYVHSAVNGKTVLRICGLQRPMPKGPIDITMPNEQQDEWTIVTYGKGER